MKSDRLYRISVRILPTLVVALMKLWFATCRVTIHNIENGVRSAREGEPIVAVFFHYGIMYFLYFLRRIPAAIMVSRSKDGEYIAEIGKKLGYVPIRGSRSTGGMQALKSMIRHMRDGCSAGIVADGSQGPPLVVQAGCIAVASKTGAPVIPLMWSCRKYIRFNSWDGTAFPYPFSRIDLYFGEPLYVPPKIKSAEIEKYRLVLEEQMKELYTKAWSRYGRLNH